MPASEQIPRIRIDPDGLDFETLRKEAIGKVQELSGDIWTDYNLHDPGVTILEQLCYGLTDLSYRSGFTVPDYLTGEKGTIDYQQQALYSPEEILPSAAVTGIDYQKILYDAIPEIDYVWLEPSATEENALANGLYTVFVKLDDELIQSRADPPKQSESLSDLSGKLERINAASEQVRSLLDQLGHQLDACHENLKRGHDFAADIDLPLPASEQLAAQIGGILHQLDSSLSNVDAIWSKVGSIWSIINSSFSADLSVRLNEVLFKLDAVFHYAKLNDALENILAAIESNPDDWIANGGELLAKLVIPLSRFESVLSRLDKILAGIGDGLFSEIDTPDQRAGKLDEKAVIQKIRSVFAAHRNLCEDIHRVEIIRTIPYFLAGEIEIQPAHNSAKIYAEIFLRCAHYISSGIQIDRYESILSQTGNYEQVFSGPLTQHGFISDRCFEGAEEILSVVDLITLISQIDGVSKVHDLYLINQENKKCTSISYDSSRYEFPDLCFPKSGKPKQLLRLVLPQDVSRKNHDGKASGFTPYENAQDEALLEETRLELKKLIFAYHAFRNNRPPFAHLIPLPSGEQRVSPGYYSIQNHFPAVYGINRYGIPQSESPEVKAKAKQLKAYLFPYEQLMADYLKHLQEMPRLFSLDSGLEQSYFSQFLDNRNIPGIESLYVDGNQQSRTTLSKILARYDRFTERRNRVLDTVLAMYGEQYPQRSLQQFDCYRRADQGKWVIENKINYLQCIREITRDRAKGFNYLKPVWHAHHGELEENLAGAHKRISILLGLQSFDRIALITDVLAGRNSRLIPDQILADSVQFLPEEIESRAIPVVFEAEKFAEIAIPAKLPPFGYGVFKDAVEIKNFRLISTREYTAVCLKSGQNARLWPLSRKRNRDEAVRYAHEFCSAITQLNIACESFHMIEHVLLRSQGEDVATGIPGTEDFFDFRVSVIFPSWTARFANTAFRKFAEETVIKNLPAHILPEFYWFDFVHMQDFEQRYKTWLFCLQQANLNQQDDFKLLNRASERIVSFLLKNRGETDCECWL
ncbi:MAG: hypothetical protein LZF85_06770 [Nitrosomonas sp.]|uniref:hypothetical protein n=1 Tax=Nitrosomonas sp. TaxID=42353 RepID=UPI0025D22BB7|nr:hypothetical protein [Nitrosomonas sp.]UJP04126.1 MAG: hypothetical protein LZF85_06770 [Nitrosomonas sp.]